MDPAAQIYAKSADGKMGAFRAQPIPEPPAGVLELLWLPTAAAPGHPLVTIGVCGALEEQPRLWDALKALGSKVHYKAHRPPVELPWVGVCVQPALFEYSEATERLQEVF